jgi:hypothetical protein
MWVIERGGYLPLRNDLGILASPAPGVRLGSVGGHLAGLPPKSLRVVPSVGFAGLACGHDSMNGSSDEPIYWIRFQMFYVTLC